MFSLQIERSSETEWLEWFAWVEEGVVCLVGEGGERVWHVCLSVFALDASAELAIALQFVRRRDSQSTQSKRLFISEIVFSPTRYQYRRGK